MCYEKVKKRQNIAIFFIFKKSVAKQQSISKKSRIKKSLIGKYRSNIFIFFTASQPFD